MIKSKDIKKSIIETIHKNFSVKVLNSEAKSDLKGPYFFVYIESFNRESFSNSNDYLSYGVVIQYQKADKNSLAEIGDKLSEIFNYSIKIGDLPILITNNSWDIEDNSIFFNFEVGFYVDKIKNDVDTELMRQIFIEYERR